MFFISDIYTAATVFGVLLDNEKKVKVIFERKVVSQKWYGCSDGTTTGYLKIDMELIVERFLPAAGHIPGIVRGTW